MANDGCRWKLAAQSEAILLGGDRPCLSVPAECAQACGSADWMGRSAAAFATRVSAIWRAWVSRQEPPHDCACLGNGRSVRAQDRWRQRRRPGLADGRERAVHCPTGDCFQSRRGGTDCADLIGGAGSEITDCGLVGGTNVYGRFDRDLASPGVDADVKLSWGARSLTGSRRPQGR